MNKSKGLKEKITEILKNKFTGSNHLGEVYFTEATSELEALFREEREKTLKELEKVIDLMIEKAERSYQSAVSDQVAPYRNALEDLLEFRSELRKKLNK